MITLEMQFVAAAQELPNEEMFQSWARAIETNSAQDQEVSVRIVDESEMTLLNEQYRKKQGSTNVLSFPADLPPSVDVPFLGDIVICAPVVVREATEQGKSCDMHWAHMLVHGILHLQGYDHIDETEALQMERLETEIMHKLGFDNPYVCL